MALKPAKTGSKPDGRANRPKQPIAKQTMPPKMLSPLVGRRVMRRLLISCLLSRFLRRSVHTALNVGVFIERQLALALPLRAALVLRGAYAAADELTEGGEGEKQEWRSEGTSWCFLLSASDGVLFFSIHSIA